MLERNVADRRSERPRLRHSLASHTSADPRLLACAPDRRAGLSLLAWGLLFLPSCCLESCMKFTALQVPARALFCGRDAPLLPSPAEVTAGAPPVHEPWAGSPLGRCGHVSGSVDRSLRGHLGGPGTSSSAPGLSVFLAHT